MTEVTPTSSAVDQLRHYVAFGYISSINGDVNLDDVLTSVLSTLSCVQHENAAYRTALEKLACLGNGSRPGNSTGNRIAQEALTIIPHDEKAS